MSTEGDPQLDRLADERAALRRELADISDGAASAENAAPRLAETLLQAGALSRPIEEHLIAMRYHALMVGRLSAELAAQRNDLVVDLTAQVFIAHAAPGRKAEAFARKLVESGKPLLTLDSPANENLMVMGARTVQLHGAELGLSRANTTDRRSRHVANVQ